MKSLLISILLACVAFAAESPKADKPKDETPVKKTKEDAPINVKTYHALCLANKPKAVKDADRLIKEARDLRMRLGRGQVAPKNYRGSKRFMFQSMQEKRDEIKKADAYIKIFEAWK